ncbi:ARM repeat-containing protein [Ramicandelaber brevisporus]|nr:ARM repeat-containing protein [Ramicandelaber brevisporus]
MTAHFARHELAVQQLLTAQSLDGVAEPLRILRDGVIGSLVRKDRFLQLGITPRLVDIFRHSMTTVSTVTTTAAGKDAVSLAEQAAIVLGSLAYARSANTIETLKETGAFEALLDCLESTSSSKSNGMDEDVNDGLQQDQRQQQQQEQNESIEVVKLRRAVARTLKAMYSRARADIDALEARNISCSTKLTDAINDEIDPVRSARAVAASRNGAGTGTGTGSEPMDVDDEIGNNNGNDDDNDDDTNSVFHGFRVNVITDMLNDAAICEYGASIAASASHSASIQMALCDAGVIPPLVDMLVDAPAVHGGFSHSRLYQPSSPKQIAALRALTALCYQNSKAASVIVSQDTAPKSAVTVLFDLIRRDGSEVQLNAAKCIVNIYCSGALDEYSDEVNTEVIPTLIRLSVLDSNRPGIDSMAQFHILTSAETGNGSNGSIGGMSNAQIAADAMFALASLVTGKPRLQKVACDAGAIALLARLLSRPEPESVSSISAALQSARNSGAEGDSSNIEITSSSHPQISSTSAEYAESLRQATLKEAALYALGALCSIHEDSRKNLTEAKVLPIIANALSHWSDRVRIAACQCIRVLSRSVRALRTAFVDAGIARPLFAMIAAKEPVLVQTVATAALCNVIIAFSPSREIILEHNGIERLVEIARTSARYPALRGNALSSLANSLYEASQSSRLTILNTVTVPFVSSILDDSDEVIVNHALQFMRNLLTCNDAATEKLVQEMTSERIVRVISDRLIGSLAALRENALFTMVGLAIAHPPTASLLCANPTVLGRWLQALNDTEAKIRVAAAWAIINFTSASPRNSDSTVMQGVRNRIDILRRHGFEDKLRELASDPNHDVRDRAKSALAQLAQFSTSSAGLHSILTPGSLHAQQQLRSGSSADPPSPLGFGRYPPP